MKSELILSLLGSPLVAHFLSPDTERLPALQRARHLERVTVAVQPQEKANPGAARSGGDIASEGPRWVSVKLRPRT